VTGRREIRGMAPHLFVEQAFPFRETFASGISSPVIDSPGIGIGKPLAHHLCYLPEQSKQGFDEVAYRLASLLPKRSCISRTYPHTLALPCNC